MFGRVLSALFSFASWFVTGAVVKFGIFTALFFVTTQFIPLLSTLLPSAGPIRDALNAQGEGVWYFLNLFHFGTGVSLCMSASVTAFIIRRIPLIG